MSACHRIIFEHYFATTKLLLWLNNSTGRFLDDLIVGLKENQKKKLYVNGSLDNKIEMPV